MTAIVGVQTELGTWLAADQQNTFGQRKQNVNKIHRLTCGIVIANAGHTRDAQIIQYEAAPRPRHDTESDMDWLVRAFVPSVYDALKRYERDYSHSEAALSYRGKLYHLACDLCVTPCALVIIGSGAEVMVGKLHGIDLTNPESAMITAVTAAADNTIYVNDVVDTLFDPSPYLTRPDIGQ